MIVLRVETGRFLLFVVSVWLVARVACLWFSCGLCVSVLFCFFDWFQIFALNVFIVVVFCCVFVLLIYVLRASGARVCPVCCFVCVCFVLSLTCVIVFICVL